MQSIPPIRAILLGGAILTLAACGGVDFDLRRFGGPGLDTSQSARGTTASRPRPDTRGLISYPGYQVAIARRGDTVEDVAARVGLPADELARYNGIPASTPLRPGEVLALPRRISTMTGGPGDPETIDIETLAGDAIDRADADSGPVASAAPPPVTQAGPEPIRHQVTRGETAYSIARSYGVSVRALADWNGLGADLTVRNGQFLLIPPVAETPPRGGDAAVPGAGTETPTPPSASTPLPEQDESPANAAAAPASPDLGSARTEASQGARMTLPVDGKIIRAFKKGKTDGIDIAASAGTPVVAAADGTVAAITRDTKQVPILVIRHADNLLTVYANIDGLKVKKGDRVKRGQKIAEIRDGEPAFLHFELREGFESIDPMPYLN